MNQSVRKLTISAMFLAVGIILPMAFHSLVYLYGHPVIRKETEEIDASYPQLKELIENMYETMYATEGIGSVSYTHLLAVLGLVVWFSHELRRTYYR